ncbi:hypothetical protein METHB2_460005 [Candidatus Methylobacter favarea]|uniref:Uncharacterized protein n=1 Tax=Candidatus Methylobacter favarea TaxID=2707345 RepID=A0A8S0X243_9GAMM|nr:hypothetical protein METHB2_460005 [Candidatus Methylobacter favarea]
MDNINLKILLVSYLLFNKISKSFYADYQGLITKKINFITLLFSKAGYLLLRSIFTIFKLHADFF